MRITETGKAVAGYTLLEVLGVLLLIGLVTALVRPEMLLSVERNRLRHVGELVRADLDRVQAEAKTGTEVIVSFNPSGYDFTIGNTVITRDFQPEGLRFRVTNDAATGGAVFTVHYFGTVVDPAVTLAWESRHYQGTLAIGTTGTVQWSYHPK
jgi:type II secretory pathway pseudopilin PulG